MGTTTVIELDHVSIRYRLARHRVPSFKEYAIHWLRGSLTYSELWALRDVSLSVEAGSSVGIVGRNGAGKSTLLKVVSRILKPTRGTATTHGHVAPILELGTGFDFELSGRENIYLNALLLGRTRREIAPRFDEIVEFSGLGDFIHSPIRAYSSGMLARLGFSIASAFCPDVLILDEILTVGDTEFQRRCKNKLAELKALGTTQLLVSHSSLIGEHCERCLWLDEGRVREDGDAKTVLAHYIAHFDAPGDPRTMAAPQPPAVAARSAAPQ